MARARSRMCNAKDETTQSTSRRDGSNSRFISFARGVSKDSIVLDTVRTSKGDWVTTVEFAGRAGREMWARGLVASLRARAKPNSLALDALFLIDNYLAGAGG